MMTTYVKGQSNHLLIRVLYNLLRLLGYDQIFAANFTLCKHRSSLFSLILSRLNIIACHVCTLIGKSVFCKTSTCRFNPAPKDAKNAKPSMDSLAAKGL